MMIYCKYQGAAARARALDLLWGEDFDLTMVNRDVAQMRVLYAFALKEWGAGHCNTLCAAKAALMLYRKRKLAICTYNIRACNGGFTITA